MNRTDTKRAAVVLLDYKADIAQISRAFIENNTDLPPQIMVVGLMEVTIGLYRALSGEDRQRFLTGINAMWDTMDEHRGEKLQ